MISRRRFARLTRLSPAFAITLATPIALAEAPAPPPAAPAPPAQAAPAPPAEAPPAAAPSLADSLTGQAKEDYEVARTLYKLGDFAGALLKLQHAYDASKDFRLLWNLAAAEKNLRRYTRVELLLERYIAEGAGRLTEAEKAEAASSLATARSLIGDVTLTANEAGAEVFVDDVRVGSTPLAAPLRVDMGKRRLRVSKAGFSDWTLEANVVGREGLTVTAVVEKAPKEGKLRVTADSDATVRIDGKVVGKGTWEGPLASGAHGVEVTAPGRSPYRDDVVIEDEQLSTLRVDLQPEGASAADKKSDLTWLFVTGGAVLAAGLGTGAYFLFKPEDPGRPAPVAGSLHTLELPLRF